MVNALFGLRGRMRRWPFVLILLLNQSVATSVTTIAFMMAWAGPVQLGLPRGSEDLTMGVMLGLLALTAWIYVAICVKRLHDLDCAGWHLVWITGLALGLGPTMNGVHALVGMAVALASLGGVLWLIFVRGTPGPNRFGPEPGVLPARGSVPTVG